MTFSVSREFIIPLEKDDLLVHRANAYSVKAIEPLASLTRAIDATRVHFQDTGTFFITECFDTFFSILVHGNKVEFNTTIRAFDRIQKAVNKLIEEMEAIFENGKDISLEQKPKYRYMNKMYAYIFSSLASSIEDYVVKNSNDSATIGKRKKASQKSDFEAEWERRRQFALETIYRWFQIPLQKLWTPPIVEDLFISNLVQFCYKVLEQSRDAKNKVVRETIFHVLGVLIKRYNQGITCVVRVIQLVQLYDVLTIPLATGVVQMVEETGCKSFITEMIREIGQNEPGETEARNIATFLEAVASTKPELILPIIDDITEYLASDCYSMRNCVIGVLGAVLIESLSNDKMTDEERCQRDEGLDSLFEHICDSHAYVRSKVLQVWQRLCCAGAVPLQRQSSLIKAVTMHLDDKSAQVRKQALQLLRALVQCNPFAAKLDKAHFSNQLEEERGRLKEITVAVVSLTTGGDVDRLELWNSLVPELRQAITKVLSDESNNNVSSDDEDDESENDRDIDGPVEFEKIRHFLLTEEVTKAVEHLQSIFRRLPDAPDMHGMRKKDKEDCLLLCLQKIFTESEKHPETGASSQDQTDQERHAIETDNHHAARLKELHKRKLDMAARRKIVNYIENCLKFAEELEVAIPQAASLLFATAPSVAIEACTFLGTAAQFDVPKALEGVRKALFQVYSRDQSVRNNVASVYKDIYLKKKDDMQASRQTALVAVKSLIELLQAMENGQSQALCQLVGTWRENGDLGPEEFQVMWEKFSMKIPNTSPMESRAALVLLTMAAETDPSLITNNLEVLIKVGLGPRSKTDLFLARDTCRALLKIKRIPEDSLKTPLRYHNDHAMFEEIVTLVIDSFTCENNAGYISFSADAINVIYQLANCPNSLSKRILCAVLEKSDLTKQTPNEAIEGASLSRRSSSNERNLGQSQPNRRSFECTVQVLTRLLHIVGHMNIRELVHLDSTVYKEMKRRNTLREMKKGNKATQQPVSTPASAQRAKRTQEGHNISTTAEDHTEEVLVGATADDTEADLITNVLETEIITGKGLFAQFVPIVLDVCRHPEKYNDELLQTSGVLALCKMMTVSSAFCVTHLQLLVTIMERSPYPGIRANVLIGLSDLTSRFPNKIEPWSNHLYGRLRDENDHVRCTCVKVLSNLIMREMIRVKGQVSGLALSMIDPVETIRESTKQFFKELSLKGNALYNAMPDILSHLVDADLNLDEKDFQEIIKYILGLQQKERQVDTIIEKLCTRLQLATIERQWRDLAYCLSLLTFSVKSIRYLMDCLPQLKDKIYYKPVSKALQTIIETAKKKPETKAVILELEQKLEKLLDPSEVDASLIDDRLAMPPPPTPRKQKKTRRVGTQRDSSSDEDSNGDDEDDDNTGRQNTPSKSAKKKAPPKSSVKRKKAGTPSPATARLKRNKLLEAVESPNTSEISTPRRSARSKKRL